VERVACLLFHRPAAPRDLVIGWAGCCGLQMPSLVGALARGLPPGTPCILFTPWPSQASAAAVGSSLPQSARGYLGYVTSHIGDSQVRWRQALAFEGLLGWGTGSQGREVRLLVLPACMHS
jgi:hypothetical protein